MTLTASIWKKFALWKLAIIPGDTSQLTVVVSGRKSWDFARYNPDVINAAPTLESL